MGEDINLKNLKKKKFFYMPKWLKLSEVDDGKAFREFKIKDHINRRVRDHCHITGKYRGSAHNDCNLKLRLNPEYIKIPVIFHNLKGYDSHFIMQKIGKMIEDEVVYDIYHQKKKIQKKDILKII